MWPGPECPDMLLSPPAGRGTGPSGQLGRCRANSPPWSQPAPAHPGPQPSPGAPAPPALTLPPLVLALHQAPVGRALPCPVIFQSPAVLPPVTPAPWKETPLTCTATAARRTEWRGTERRGRRPPQAGPWEGRTQTWGEGAAPGLHSSSCWSRSPSRPESPGRGAQVLHGARGSAGPKRRVR